MINKNKLIGCQNSILKLCDWLDIIYGGHLIINSGYRSPQENASLPNAAKNSMHMQGLAVDCSINDLNCIRIINKVLDNIITYPIKGIGIDIYKNYCHLDFRPATLSGNNIDWWSYGKDGFVY